LGEDVQKAVKEYNKAGIKAGEKEGFSTGKGELGPHLFLQDL